MGSRWSRTLFLVLAWLTVAACSGSGCGSCAGGALQPIAGGFPLTPDRRIPRSIQLRLTDQGLRKVEQIAPDLFAQFLGSGVPISRTQQNVNLGLTSCTITICDAGCTLPLALSTTPPPLQLTPLDGMETINTKIRIVIPSTVIPISGCSFNGGLRVDTSRGGHGHIGLETNITMRRDSHAPRLNYIRPDIGSVSEISGEGIENEDFNCEGSGIWSSIVCGVVNTFARSTIRNLIRDQLNQATAPLSAQLAHKAMPSPPGCPTGTTVDGSNCKYSDNSLVPLLLGTDGEGNMGALLASITPGVRAQAQYVIAAGDNQHGAETSSTGVTIDTFGAVVSMAHNQCVPRMTAPAIPTIPEFMSLRANVIPGTTTPVDLGIGVAEPFLNHTMWNLWDSGMFCLGINTRTSQQISSMLLGVLVRSLGAVSFPLTNAPMGIALRPQDPPVITVGSGADINTAPLLRIAMTHLAVDFYVWSEERYVRFMTATTDLTIPINLVTEGMGLRPTIGMVSAANVVISNNTLITDRPAALQNVLQNLLGTLIGQAAGNLPVINIPSVPIPGMNGMSAGNLLIRIPAGGIKGVNESSTNYLGLFATLDYQRGMMSNVSLDTAAEIDRVDVDAAAYASLETLSGDRLARVRVRAAAIESFGHDTEFATRADGLTWSEWQQGPMLEVTSPSFAMQGTHTIEVRARVKDVANSADPEPVTLSFVIDTASPTLRVERSGEQLVAFADDPGAPVESLEYLASFDGVDQAWTHDSQFAVPASAQRYVIRVRDAAGHESSVEGELQPKLLNGGPSTDPSNGCSCSTVGRTRFSRVDAVIFTLASLGLSLWLMRRRRRAIAQGLVLTPVAARRVRRAHTGLIVGSMVPTALGVIGCACGGMPGSDAGDVPAVDVPPDIQCTGGGMVCPSTLRCVAPPTQCNCPTGQVASTPTFDNMTCEFTCQCVALPKLNAGMAGSHLDMAIASDGTTWMSSYSEGDPFQPRSYGDLIVGRFNATDMSVDWQHVDGVPAAPATPMFDPTGWRNGIGDSGPDVGRWNSMRLDSMGRPRVAYWDTTNGKLKFAAFDGTRWTTHVVDEGGRNGQYASMVLLAGGEPAIAYRAVVADTMMAGRILTVVRYARAMSATPGSARDWVISEVASAPTPCRASSCATGQVCQQSTGLCVAPTTNCPSACAVGQSCIAGSCQAVYASNYVEDFPPGIGLFNSLALDSMGRPQLVWYDRTRGNLMGSRVMTGTTWVTPFVIDGEMGTADLGDRGAWASLALDSSGNWHVAYRDGWDETLRYARVVNGAVMRTETVDDGIGLGMMEFEDQRHLVGDSASIGVDTMGVVRIAYQDSTAGTLRLAVSGMQGWTRTVVDMANNTGYWARLRGTKIATFWRDMVNKRFGVRVFTTP